MSGISPFSSSLWTPPGLSTPSRVVHGSEKSENPLVTPSHAWNGGVGATTGEHPEGAKPLGGGFKRWNGGGGLMGFTPLRFGDQEERRPVSSCLFALSSTKQV